LEVKIIECKFSCTEVEELSISEILADRPPVAESIVIITQEESWEIE